MRLLRYWSNLMLIELILTTRRENNIIFYELIYSFLLTAPVIAPLFLGSCWYRSFGFRTLLGDETETPWLTRQINGP